MGTRNLTIVISEEKTKVAQYGQWDGYPDGQGTTILQFLKMCNLKKFKTFIDELSFYDAHEIEQIISNDNWRIRYPHLSRDIGGGILETIYEGIIKKLINKESFSGDSLFCEWAYVVDLDKEVLEVYTGFNTDSISETDRFFKFKMEDDREDKSDNYYYPIKLLKSFSLIDLPEPKEFAECLEALDDANYQD